MTKITFTIFLPHPNKFRFQFLGLASEILYFTRNYYPILILPHVLDHKTGQIGKESEQNEHMRLKVKNLQSFLAQQWNYFQLHQHLPILCTQNLKKNFRTYQDVFLHKMTILRARGSTNSAEEEILSNISWSALNLLIHTNHNEVKRKILWCSSILWWNK